MTDAPGGGGDPGDPGGRAGAALSAGDACRAPLRVTRSFPPGRRFAAALVLFLVPGLVLPGRASAGRTARRSARRGALPRSRGERRPLVLGGAGARGARPLLAHARGARGGHALGAGRAGRGRPRTARLVAGRCTGRGWRAARSRPRRARARAGPADAAQRVRGGRPRSRHLRRGHGADRAHGRHRVRRSRRALDSARGRGALLPDAGERRASWGRFMGMPLESPETRTRRARVLPPLPGLRRLPVRRRWACAGRSPRPACSACSGPWPSSSPGGACSGRRWRCWRRCCCP